ncbi:MAG: Stk1 family PASTA domain-containing Ser/Thr kinase [Erysipelotrichaceae bacterium]|nr:Stk1 family PASTA domain-containing Ser/Thr kinase [Erysipelotrichaceae bacterium]
MSEYIGKRYRIVKLIGKGGMADVYLAFDTILKREVAVKVLKSDMSDDPVALERFKREAGAVTKLSHPNIVDVYDVGDDGDKHYIVMEYVKGYTLKQLIKKRGPIPYKEAVWMMKQLAGALMEAHRNNVIHRDVKSQNVLIKDDGTIKLSDFGIAMASGAMQITHKDSILGSVHYLAPEISKGKQASMQSDIYSLGIVFYELLTGDVPFKADNPVQVALKHVKENIPSVRSFDPNIPQSVENIILKATAKNVNERYKNIALMIQDLNECLKRARRNEPRAQIRNTPERRSIENIHISDTANKKTKKGTKDTPLLSIFLLCTTIFSVIVLFMLLFITGVIGRGTKTVTVPQIRNLTVQEAKDLLALNNLEVDDSHITWTLSDNVQKDLIISSVPEEGEEVESGTKVKLTVSSGIYSILGDYTGVHYTAARDELIALNFKVKLVPVESDEEPGTVIEQSLPAKSKYDASKNNEITLKYSLESAVLLPYDLYGKSLSEASSYFRNNDVEYEFSKQSKEFFTAEEVLDAPPGTVVRTLPELGSTYLKSADEKVIVYYYEEN